MFKGLIWRRSREKGDDSMEGMASTSGEYVEEQSSILSLQPWVFRKESCGIGEESMMVKCGLNEFREEREDGFSMRFGGGVKSSRSAVKGRRGRRPVVRSGGNCLVPQLYDQHFGFDEYVLSSESSEAELGIRPFIVTDGERVISKSSCVPSVKQVKNGLDVEVFEDDLEVMGDAVGFVPLRGRPKRTPKRKSRDDQYEVTDALNLRRNGKPSHSQGSPDRMLLFSLGISIGVISAIISKRKEVEKLNSLLTHSENLVQDLQDELDMKESLTVKELVDGDCQNQELPDSSADITEATDSFRNHVPVSGLHYQEIDQIDQPVSKAVRDAESMSIIEAELEAELERLELNMSSSCLEGKASVLDEFDSDLMGDVVKGELRADMFNSRVQEDQADLDGDSSGTSTPDTQNPNYAVSPRELSLRLHELLQCRLEERIEELERELQHSQKQPQYVESEAVLSQGTISTSDVGSTDQESPTVEQECDLSQPLCLNLSGDALNAYEEAYAELMNMSDTEEEVTNIKRSYEDGLNSTNLNLICGVEGDYLSNSSTEVEYIQGKLTWKQLLNSAKGLDSEDDCNGGDEYEIDDEEGKVIQQIIELTRQGSPVVLNAKKMLFSMDM